MSNSKKITKNVGGRPTKKTPDVVNKLVTIFQRGGTVEEACSYARIHKQSYYNWLKEDESFSTEIEAAQHYADIAAKRVVVDNIIEKEDLNTSKWWLEKRQFNKPQAQINIASKEMSVEFIEYNGPN